MKILMLLESTFPPDVRVEKEIGTLADDGHEVHVLCYLHDAGQPSVEHAAKAQVHRIRISYRLAKWARALMLHVPAFDLLWRFQLRKTLEEIQPDVVHAHDLPPGRPAADAIAAHPGRKPRLILDLHENYPDLLRSSTFATNFPQRLFFDFERWVALEGATARRADHLIVVSEENEERLRRVHDVRGPISVVPNYADLQGFGEPEPKPDTRVHFDDTRTNLLYVGGIHPSRDLESVFKGLALARRNGTRINFVLLGSGSSREGLEKLAAELQLEDTVRFAGQVSQTKVWEYIACTDVCLLPLKPTTQNQHTDPNKLYQYAYFAKPVIAAGTDHIRHRVGDMNCGVTYEPGNPASFAEALRDLLGNRDQMATMAQSGRSAVLDRYNWAMAARALREAYAKIA